MIRLAQDRVQLTLVKATISPLVQRSPDIYGPSDDYQVSKDSSAWNLNNGRHGRRIKNLIAVRCEELMDCALKLATMVGKPEGKNHWGDQDVDGRIILRWIFRKWEGVVETE